MPDKDLTSVPARVQDVEEALAMHTAERKVLEARVAEAEKRVAMVGKVSAGDLVKIAGTVTTIISALAALVIFAIDARNAGIREDVKDLKQATSDQEAITRGLGNELSYLRGKSEGEGGNAE